MTKYRKLLFITIIGFFISTFLSFYNLKSFDRYELSTDEKDQHAMVKGDIVGHWEHAKSIKEELKEKPYFETGRDHYQNYLPSKILLIYSYLTNDELIIEDQVTIGNKKFYLLLFQSIFFYFSIYFFSMQLSKKINNNTFLYTAIFLCFEPTIFQWQSSFWTESIFFSLQLICFGIFIKTHKTLLHILLIGFLIGLMSLQRSAALYYIFPVIIYSLFFFKKSKLIKLFTLILGFSVVMSFLSYHNYKRSGVFYFIPGDHKDVMQMYVYKALIAKVENLNHVDVNKKVDNFFSKWVEKNKIDLNKETDRLIFLDYKKDIVLKYILKHPIQLIEYVISKSLHTLVLDPVHIINFHKFEYKSANNPYYKSDNQKFWIPIRIIYSLIIYGIIFLGFLHSLQKSEKSLIIFSLLSVLYFTLILCWMGNPRYFMPSLIYLSVFFGFGIDYILNKTSKKTI